MPPAITLSGIDQAISNLGYVDQMTLKYRLVHAIREHYRDEGSIETLQKIADDVLIGILWGGGHDPSAVRRRRKNLSSVRSSVNADLKRLYDEEKNIEGLIIGPDNTFLMSDRAKDRFLEAFRCATAGEGRGSVAEIAEIIRVLRETLSESGAAAWGKGDPGWIDRLQGLIRALSEWIPEGEAGAGLTDDGDDVEIIDVEETDEDLESLDDSSEAASQEVGSFDPLEDIDLYEGPDAEVSRERAGLLAEAFNRSLAAMDRFYNQYIFVPEGEYVVGRGEPGEDERPETPVALSPLYFGKFPVTNALFEVFVERTGYLTTAEKTGYGTVYQGRSRMIVDPRTGRRRFIWNSALAGERVEGACWYRPLGPGSTLHRKRNHPVVQVSLEDALAFAAWTGKRLPTEDEWEAVSRTSRGTVYPWGNEWKGDACNLEESSIGDTTAVGRYLETANDLGIADTLGNVLEWTLTPAGEGALRYHIAKGGAWVTGGTVTLCSRFHLPPETQSNILGFRCVAF